MSDTKPKAAAPKTARRKVTIDEDGTIHTGGAPKNQEASKKPSPQPQQPQQSQSDSSDGGCAGCFGQMLGLFFWGMIIMFVLHLLGLA